MSNQKLLAREEKIKEKISNKKKEEKKEEKPKKKVEIKKPKTNKAKARGSYLPISVKIATEIGRKISGMEVTKAKNYLGKVVEMKLPVPYRRYNRDVPHKKSIGPGRYPKKVAKYMLDLLESAISNAKYFELNEDDLFIKEVKTEMAVSRKKGKYSNVEIVVQEKVKK